MGASSSRAWSIARYISTHDGLQAILNSSHDATYEGQELPPKTTIGDLTTCSEAYNKHKIVQLLNPGSIQPGPRFLLSIPQNDSLLPNQLLNEVGCLLYAKSHTTIPVPRVYSWSIEAGQEYIAREYIEGVCLNSVWDGYTEDEKETVATQLAKIIVEMVETRFDMIGGIMPDESLGPTVESSKIFKGRGKLHDMGNYNIGPYKSIHEYAHSYIDKEIHYFSSSSPSDLDYKFDKTPLQTFIAELVALKSLISSHEFRKNEPFVLFHGDFHGRNVIVRGTDVVGIIDWDFAGAYPLSEVFNRGWVTVVEYRDAESSRENSTWGRRILNLVGEMVRERGWKDQEVEWLVGADGADSMVGEVTTEQYPVEYDGSDVTGGSVRTPSEGKSSGSEGEDQQIQAAKKEEK